MGKSPVLLLLPCLTTPFLVIFFLQLHFFVYFSNSLSFASVYDNHLCPDKERQALFQFKQTLSISIHSDASKYCDYFGNTPSYPKTNKWNMSSDCCQWDGITCNRLTGDVIRLDLSCSQLVGVLHSNSSLFQLPYLQRLNLAFNDFSGSMIPHEFGRFATSLTHLNLSYSNFSGPVPLEISHLSKLVSLDLSYNYNLILNDSNREFQHLFFLQNLSSFCCLTFLDLSGTGLRGELPHEIFFLPNLKALNLGDNPNVTGVLPQSNLGASNGPSITSLKELDLSSNTMLLLSEEVRDIVGSLKSLKSLKLMSCNLSGAIPQFILNLTYLTELDLSGNYLEGRIPSWVANLSQLVYLDLSYNLVMGPLSSNIIGLQKLTFLDLSAAGLSGELPHDIFFLPNLKTLNLHYNPNVTGVLPQSNLGVSNGSSITSLRELDLSYNTMLLEVVADIVGSLKSLKSLKLIDCNLSGVIPQFILNLTYLTKLDLSQNNLEGRIPSWVANLSQLVYLDLSYNLLMGPLSSNIIGLQKLTFLDLLPLD